MSIEKSTIREGPEARIYGDIVYILVLVSILLLIIGCVLIILRHSDAAFCTIGGLLSGDPPNELKMCYTGSITARLNELEGIGMTIFGSAAIIGLLLTATALILKKDIIYVIISLILVTILLISALGIINVSLG
ncbi:DUF1634 domain-containing protein [Caldivirga maquilingensis]|uniref:DUF1634 domain-containing protein n=1 Tax=Caldivirga maquilingensis (strain ATCC 700844 / DSM 13496 / JCM 10307 / IC-167) TaxID=397948 RepID=A8MDB8_CALMQ|nr:DUF1634 domain-containing protein [Caldivirga maquilingensis]ABW01774.1 hypothetical protein Cmaq_0942 [Caldivirga maquilingensis IC-167]